ncbi:MAG: hypothetical protein K5905_27025 [Roseibium sp.]|uniref:PDC sensor domain-containing protein n=1 Tax=Roseibium sp. TaxID=1936156 RepID=UPI00260CE057|nr:hypothetical protein [Roseibium sp.]MCV0429123.1 hypothetical protein [Roseibium sp.]
MRTTIALNRLSAERIFLAIDHALDTAGYTIKMTSNKRVVHEEFREIAERLPGVRAIILIDPSGTLTIDSYQHPPADINLSDREYVQRAQQSPGLFIGTTTIGRTSGVPFLPVAKQVGDNVVAAIVAPHFLIHEEGRCADCVSALLREDGSLIASFPPAAEIPDNVLSLPLINKGLEGSSSSLFSKTDSIIGWRRSDLYPFIVLGARGLRSGALLGVNDR